MSDVMTARVVAPPNPVAFPANIANGGSLSAPIDMGALRPSRLVMPAAWTAAAISFDVSADGETYGPLYDQYGTEASIGAGVALAGREIVLDPALFLSVRWLKVRSGLSGAAVAQAALRAVKVVGA
jgi:hypothetical protein